jgi:hypothetical protein
LKQTFSQLSDTFAKSSGAFKKANPHVFGDLGNDLALGRGTTVKNAVVRRTGTGNGKCGTMNKTEAEFGLLLDAQKRAGEILSYHFQGITLRWPVGDEIVKYTPDFVVFVSPEPDWGFPPAHDIKLIEIKGGYRKFPGYLERAIERFRHAKTYWPQFNFEMWKKEKSGWKQIL